MERLGPGSVQVLREFLSWSPEGSPVRAFGLRSVFSEDHTGGWGKEGVGGGTFTVTQRNGGDGPQSDEAKCLGK